MVSLLSSFCSIGINPEEEEKQLFLPQMCGCGNCTVDDWMQGRPCLQARKENFPELILLQRNTPIVSTLFKPNLAVDVELRAETEEVKKLFHTCLYLTIDKLSNEVSRSGKNSRKRIPLSIDKIVRLLKYQLGLPVKQEILSLDQLEEYLCSINVSWFNFKPIAVISQVFLNGIYPELQTKWEKYFRLFYDYCGRRNLKQYAGILFNTESENIFILRVDGKYYDMKLSDISCLRDSLCYVLDCNKLSVHLITISRSSLLLVFGYCFEDYHSRFQLTNEQLTCLADLRICRILSLRDYRSHFVYPNIQNTVCLILMLVDI